MAKITSDFIGFVLTLWTALILSEFKTVIGSGQPNPPNWPSGVYIFDPADPTDAQNVVNEAFANNGGMNPETNGQWSTYRYAFLLLQGVHGLNVSIGYYTTVHGLGMSPLDVSIKAVTVEDGSENYQVGALDNFWRSAENFQTTPSITYNALTEPTMLWAVSQSCPLRRAQINGGLSLYQYTGGCCAGYASGGFIGDIKVSTNIYAGSQQQFLIRNVEIGLGFEDGAWNLIFVGCSGPTPSNNGTDCHPYTSVDNTPVIAEKPFIYYNASNDNYTIIVPRVEMNKNGAGTNWGSNYDSIDFSDVYVASPDNNDSSESIQSMLDSGNDILFAPGIYNLSTSIMITRNNTIIFGIGMATLNCGMGTGDPCLMVADGVTGVRICGLLLQASDQIYQTSSLLQFGTSQSSKSKTNAKLRNLRRNRRKRWINRLKKEGNGGSMRKKQRRLRDYGSYGRNSGDIESTEYSFVTDVFARVGGTNNISNYQVSTDYMFEINVDNVIIDNTWLWRADHDQTGSVYNRSNPCNTGVVVNGDNVIAYGLKVEHTIENLVEWNGNNGATYFFQSELPYDVSQANFGDLGYVAYLVADGVTSHEAYAVGVYCYFRDYNVTVETGFSVPDSGTTVTTATTRYLNGNGGIQHIVNTEGSPVNVSNYQEYLCNYP